MLHVLLIASSALQAPPLATAPALSTRLSPPRMSARDATGLSWSPAVDAGGASVLDGQSGGPSKADASIAVQGGAMRTWNYAHPMDQARVLLETDGGPVDAAVNLWQGPDNCPLKMRVFVEDGRLCPFSAVFATPPTPSSVIIRNMATLEFPLAANVAPQTLDQPSMECASSLSPIDGDAVNRYPFGPLVDSVQVLLETQGRPLNARIEVLQGPDAVKQAVHVYTQDGLDLPFLCLLQVAHMPPSTTRITSHSTPHTARIAHRTSHSTNHTAHSTQHT